MEKKKSFFEKYGLISSVICYLLFFVVFSSFVIIILYYIFANINGLDASKLLEMSGIQFQTKDDLDKFYAYGDIYVRNYALCNGWANFIGYFLSFLGITISLFYFLKNDFISFKNNFLKLSLYTLISAIVFYAIVSVVDVLVGLGVPDSQNQNTIEIIMQNGGAVPMIITTVILAPIVEELIYRKVVFEYAKKISIPLAYIISIVLFSLPHMLSTDISSVGVGVWLLQLVPYVASAGLLALIYHKSNYNIYTTIIIHLLNNFLAVILIFI